MDVLLTTPPASEPVTLVEAKAECQIDFDTDDSLITNLITSARQLCENYCDSSFEAQTWTVQFDLGQDEYHLPKGPVSSVTHVKHVYSDNTLSDALTSGTQYYQKGLTDMWLEVQPAVSLGSKAVVGYRVEYVTGYEVVPQILKDAILKVVRHLYDDNTGGIAKIPFDVMQMLGPYRKTIV